MLVVRADWLCILSVEVWGVDAAPCVWSASWVLWTVEESG